MAASPQGRGRRSAQAAANRSPKPGAPGDDRARRHRLLPGLALGSLEDAAAFVAQMGLVLQAPHPHLPSLFAAVQGQPAKPGAGGFGQWPAHAWWWAGELAGRRDVLLTKVVEGKRTLVHESLWGDLDAAIRSRPAPDADTRALVDLLARTEAPVRTDHLRVAAGFDAGAGTKQFQKLMRRLEALGTVVCSPAVVDDHRHVSFAQLWVQRFPRPLSDRRGVDGLVAAALAAAGAAPASAIARWFAWPPDETRAALQRIERAGRATRSGDLLIAARA